ncbi:MAG: YbjN domain-containing protein [Litoreibacter sp.]
MSSLIAFSAAALLAATPYAPQRQAQIIPAVKQVSASDPETIVAALQKFGYNAVLETDVDGDPMVFSKAAGTIFSIRFYGCKQNSGCKDLQFNSGYDLPDGVSVQRIEQWNSTKLVGPALRDQDDDPFLKFFVSGVECMTIDSFERVVYRWEEAMKGFQEHIYK